MLNLEKLSSRGHLLPNLETKSRGSELHEEKQLSYVKRELFHCRFCHLISVQTGCRILGGYYMCTFYNILLGLRKVIHSQRSGSYWKPNGYFLSDIHLALYVSNHFTWLVIINGAQHHHTGWIWGARSHSLGRRMTGVKFKLLSSNSQWKIHPNKKKTAKYLEKQNTTTIVGHPVSNSLNMFSEIYCHTYETIAHSADVNIVTV